MYLESARILVGIWSTQIQVILAGMVGIWWEWGWSPSEIWVGSHWHDIPTKFQPFLPFQPDSTWIWAESVGEGKVLNEDNKV